MFNKKDGFTLIEVMIVVAIIAILASIAIPNYVNYQKKVKRSEAPMNLKAIKSSEDAYKAEFESYITLNPSPGSTPGARKRQWDDSGGFASIGWLPTGEIYGQYQTTGATISSISGLAITDIDGDNAFASFSFTQDTDVVKNTADNIF